MSSALASIKRFIYEFSHKITSTHKLEKWDQSFHPDYHGLAHKNDILWVIKFIIDTQDLVELIINIFVE